MAIIDNENESLLINKLTTKEYKEIKDTEEEKKDQLYVTTDPLWHDLSNLDEEGQKVLNAKADLESPALTGTPTAPTPANTTDNNQIATTKFVHNAIKVNDPLPSQEGKQDTALLTDGEKPFWGVPKTNVDNLTLSYSEKGELQALGVIENNKYNLSILWVGTLEEFNFQKQHHLIPKNCFCYILDDEQTQENAPIDSPEFTGTPTAPTPNRKDNSNRIATTEYIDRELISLVTTNTDQDIIGNKRFIKSPLVPTAEISDNSNIIANTAFVNAKISEIKTLPVQTTHDNQFLKTDGTNAFWTPIREVPDVKNNENKFLFSNGSVAYWTTVNVVPDTTGFDGYFLRTNGNTIFWDDASSKQDTLTSVQMDAVNSGITQETFQQFQGYQETKADKATTLAGYGITDAYTKAEIDSKTATVYRFKGSVEYRSFLPTDNNVQGDVWNVEEDGSNYAWVQDTETTGHWDALGGELDLSNYYNKQTVDSKLDEKQNKLIEGSFISITDNLISVNLEWGGISGSLSEQKDLKDTLDKKQDNLTETQLAAVNSGITEEKVNRDLVPSQEDNSGKFLTTDGVKSSWYDLKSEYQQAIKDERETVATLKGKIINCSKEASSPSQAYYLLNGNTSDLETLPNINDSFGLSIDMTVDTVHVKEDLTFTFVSESSNSNTDIVITEETTVPSLLLDVVNKFNETATHFKALVIENTSKILIYSMYAYQEFDLTQLSKTGLGKFVKISDDTIETDHLEGGQSGDVKNRISNLDVESFNWKSISKRIATSVEASDSKFATEKAVREAINESTSSIYKYKGSVETYDDLPTEGMIQGDVYNVKRENKEQHIKAGDNVAWVQDAESVGHWDVLSGLVNLSNYYDKDEIGGLLDTKADKAFTLAGYGITDAYTKAEVNSSLTEVNTLLTTEKERALSAEQTLTNNKADKATSLEAYGITNAYNKAEVDSLLNNKADKTSVYTKIETNNLLSVKANSADLASVATTADYKDLINVPTTLSEFTDNIGFATKSEMNTALSLKANDAEVVHTSIITSEASATNPLVDKAFVNSTIQTATASFDGSWDNLESVPTTEAGFTSKGFPAPSPNNYLIIIADETHDKETWRYKYTTQSVVAYDKSLWKAEYKINNSSLTAAQLAALDSGITNNLVNQITTNSSNIEDLFANKQDAGDYATKTEVYDLLDNKQNTLSSVQLEATNSGITENLVEQITLNKESISNLSSTKQDAGDYALNTVVTQGLASKQNTLNTNQLNAVNSGITENLVSKITSNETSISTLNTSKQDKLIQGEGIKIENNVISNTNRKATWGAIEGALTNQTDLKEAIGNKADILSPTFLGTPTAPTQAVTDNSDKIATTGWVNGKFKVVSSIPTTCEEGVFYFIVE